MILFCAGTLGLRNCGSPDARRLRVASLVGYLRLCGVSRKLCGEFIVVCGAPTENRRDFFYRCRMASGNASGRFTDGIGVGVLTRMLHRDLVDDVLRESGKAGQRTRLLPGRVVVYFVLALSLFSEESYEEVVRKLVNGLEFLGNWARAWTVPTSSALTQARTRLGAAPLEVLFERVAVGLAAPATRGAWYGGRRVMAVDGVMFDVPDTPDNRAEFGTYGRSDAGPFPQVRLVGLGECGTHAITAAEFDACQVQERVLLSRLIPAFTADMLVLADRGFFSYDLWRQALHSGAALVWRLKSDLHLDFVEHLPDGSWRAVLLPRAVKQRRRRRSGAPDAAGAAGLLDEQDAIEVRVIEYTVPDRGADLERVRIMTSLLDHTSAPAAELAALYAQRWEFELTLDEIETHQMSSSRMLRSRTPELVRQEIWATLLTHYCVRAFIREAADDIDEDPDILSFIRTIRIIRRQVENQAGFSPRTTRPGDPTDP